MATDSTSDISAATTEAPPRPHIDLTRGRAGVGNTAARPFVRLREAPPLHLPRERFQDFLDALHAGGRRVIGPVVDQSAIVLDDVRSVGDMPVGFRDEQAPGRYRLVETGDDRLFAYAAGPASWRRQTYAARQGWRGAVNEDGIVHFTETPVELTDGAGPVFLGVRPCDLAAMGVQDRVFLGGDVQDVHYRARRDAAFVVAVSCTHPAATCFCTSMGTGPEVREGFDLALTELDDGFVVRVGTMQGREVVDRLGLTQAEPSKADDAAAAVDTARSLIGPPAIDVGVPRRLAEAAVHPRWAEVAERCLACTNCTLVCPTCFCHRVERRSDLDATTYEGDRVWDSCFNVDFARVAGGNFRRKREHRYRQWLTHKFSSWHDQFGTTGCVGCGRCITWCPVGIDVREEVAAIAGPAPVQAHVGIAMDATGVDLQRRNGFVVNARYEEPLDPATLVAAHRETHDVVTLLFEREATATPVAPGQFVLVDVPGVAMPPISVARAFPSQRHGKEVLELTVRPAGAATAALCAMQPGGQIGLSAPRGTSWPVKSAFGRDVVIVAGGLGLPPLRSLVDLLLQNRTALASLHVYVGARSPDDIMYKDTLLEWVGRGDVDLRISVDRAPVDWRGRVGIVTRLFDDTSPKGPNAVAYVCGPEVMMVATTRLLLDRGLPAEGVFMTIERHMECGVGLCGHCQMGPYLVCRDGPVLSAAALGGVLGMEGK